MAYPPPKDLVRFLQPFDRSIQKLALAVRRLVLEELAPCHESIYDAYNAVTSGYGPTGRLRDNVCHVAVYARHVNLGFHRGAEMADPDRLLQGAGKQIRHITIRTPDDLARPAIRQYLRRARKIGESSSPPSPELKSVISVVKAIYPTRRRPKPV